MTKNSQQPEIIDTVCMLCFQVCGIRAHIHAGRLTEVEGRPEHPFSRGVVCPRGKNLAEYVYSPKRILHPMRKKGGTFVRVSWEEALDFLARELGRIKAKEGPRAVAFSVGSIGAENIAISAFSQRFRGAFGSPNFFSIEAHCFRARIMARLFTFGTYPLEDPDYSDCIVLWGHNPDTSEPPLAARIRHRLKKGDLKLVVVDPKRIPLAENELHLQLRPGTDAALALGMMNIIINEKLYDSVFVEKYCMGFERLRMHIQEYPVQKVAEICGLTQAQVAAAASLFATRKSSAIIQGINSLDQHINGFQNSRALAILQAITGNYDRKGAWATNPFMRLTDLRIPADGEPIGAQQHPMFHHFWGMTAPYGQQMLLPDVLLSGKPYPIRAMIVNGGNPAASWPDRQKLFNAFSRLDLLVVMDLFMTETAKMADLVLPACSSIEMLNLAYNYGLTGGMPVVMISKKLIEPLGECWPDWKFFTELGRRMGFKEEFPWNSDEEVLRMFLKESAITLEQIESEPNGYWYGKRCYTIDAKGQIRTPSSRIELYSQTLADAGYDPIPNHLEPTQSPFAAPELFDEYPLILNTGARMVEYTHWQMKNLPHLRRSAPEPGVELHPDTAASFYIADKDWVVVETRRGSIKVRASVTEAIRAGVVNLFHGWEGEANQNVLTELEPRDPITGYPELRALACKISKADEK
jgi:anaerobic selenocysteine-containing dehydrogenase